MKEISLNTNGMHCSSCEMLIREALEEIGASSVISYEKGTVKIRYDESSVDPETIRKVIKDQGYGVE